MSDRKVSRGATATTPSNPSAVLQARGRQEKAEAAEKPAQKGRGGAPKGNLNAVRHGAYSPRLNALKRTAAAVRDRFRRVGEREARRILEAAGLTDDPLARSVARQVGRLEAMARRLEAHHERRGYFTRAGEIKGSVSQEIQVIAKLLDEARRLFGELRDYRGTQVEPGAVYVSTLGDGTPVPRDHSDQIDAPAAPAEDEAPSEDREATEEIPAEPHEPADPLEPEAPEPSAPEPAVTREMGDARPSPAAEHGWIGL